MRPALGMYGVGLSQSVSQDPRLPSAAAADKNIDREWSLIMKNNLYGCGQHRVCQKCAGRLYVDPGAAGERNLSL